MSGRCHFLVKEMSARSRQNRDLFLLVLEEGSPQIRPVLRREHLRQMSDAQ